MLARLAPLLLLVIAGCLFKGQSLRAARQEAESNASTERNDAIKRRDFAVALAYDDAFLVRSDSPQLRADRKTHFSILLDTTLTRLGEPSDANAESYFGTLVAFRHEARRDLAVQRGERTVKADEPFAKAIEEGQRVEALGLYATGSKLRHEDLAIVDADHIAPALAIIAPLIWHRIDSLAAAGDLAAAVTLAHTLMNELPANNGFAAAYAQLKARAAAVHLALAQQAGDELPGARVLHARLAAIYGAAPGALGEPNAALIAETTHNWTVSSPGDCGASPISVGTKLDSLETRLRAEGFAPSTGQPLQLTVTFDGCPLTVREFETVEEIPYQEVQTQEIRVEEPSYSCASDTETSESHRTGDYIYTTTTTHPGRCTQTGTTSHIEKRDVLVNLVERVPIAHRIHKIAANGTIRIVFDGGTREASFSLDAESDDDTAWQRAVHGSGELAGSRTHTGLSEPQARDRLHALLLVKTRVLTGQVLAAREAVYIDKAKASIAAGKPLEADQAFYVANRIVSLLAQPTNPAFSSWMQTQYRVTPPVLSAAIAGEPLPVLDVAAGHTVEIKPVAIRLGSDVETALTTGLTSRPFRSLLFLSFTAGPSFASTTGGTGSIHGVIGSFQLAVFGHRNNKYAGGVELASGGGFRISGGYDGHSNGLVDIDAFLGYGARFHWLSLAPIAGVGLDFTAGNDDKTSISPDVFKLPVGAYAEYGFRTAYAFEPALTLELIYTKAFRTASGLPRTKRADIRLATIVNGFPLGITVRYAEYLTTTDNDGVFTAFSSDRAAKTYWVLGGFGF